MRTVLALTLMLSMGLALGFAWAGLICLNSGDPDYTEHFWRFGFIAFLVSFLCSIGLAANSVDPRAAYRPARDRFPS